MSTLAHLATTALLGTERRGPQWPAHDNEVGILLDELPKDKVEKALLQTAGVLGTCELAGLMPHKIDAAPSLSAADAMPHNATPALLQVLAGILEDGPQRLQAEAFRALAQAKRGMPHRLLPKALDCGKRSTPLRPLLLAVIGERGLWLARQNEAWAYAVGVASDAPDETLWSHGSLDQRKLHLISLHRTDADKARELIAEALKTEGARERTAFIECLAKSLSITDQDLLEGVLRDKSKEARAAALRLLSSLPTSRFMQRMVARIEPCIHVEKKFLRGTVASIEPPAAFVAEWKDDLIEESKPQSAKFGERAWWLLQLVRATPLRWWEERLALKPAELIAWAQKSEWKDVLLQAWATAQSYQRYSEWAEAFLDANLAIAQLDVTELMESLPLVLREKHFLKRWPPTEPNASASLMLDRLLAGVGFDASSLSLDTARRILQTLKRLVNEGRARYDWQLRVSLSEFACLVPPALFDECATGWEITKEEAQPFAEAVARVGIILDQRKAITQL